MATNMFLKLGEIVGESEDENHPKWIEILSMSHSFSQPTAAVRGSSGATTEKANHSDISITKYLDCATDAILSTCWTGEQLPKSEIEFFRSDGSATAVKYLKIDLENVIVSNYSISAGGGDIPMENISLAYGKVTYNYIPVTKETGDAAANQPVKADLIKSKVEG